MHISKEHDMMVMVAKTTDARFVEVVRVAETVAFSDQPGWVMICRDWQQSERRKSQFQWVPASTRFEWVREFVGAEE
jgi:hypothetical protein